MATILCIARRAAWERARAAGEYRTESLDSEGFIHASTPAQVCAVADRIYRDQRDLLLLCVDPARVTAEIRYEGKPGGQQYPHIYGPLNTDAVIAVLDFEPGTDGRFSLPDGLPL